MSAVSVHLHIDSDTLQFPELKQFIGQDVRVDVTPVKAAATYPKSAEHWDSVRKGIREMEGYDFEAVELQNQLEWDVARRAAE